MFRIGCLLVIVLVAAYCVAVAKFLPWWGALLAIIGLGVAAVLILPKLIGRGISKFGMALFETKSKVLRDAGITIHTIEWTQKPELPEDEDEEFEDDEEDDDETENLCYLMVETTISPKPCDGCEMQHFEPGEMLLVPFDKPVDSKSMLDDSDDDGPEASTAHVLFIQPDGNSTDEWDKVTGEHRIRFVFAVPDNLTGRVKFQYYFEGLGDLFIPEGRA